MLQRLTCKKHHHPLMQKKLLVINSTICFALLAFALPLSAHSFYENRGQVAVSLIGPLTRCHPKMLLKRLTKAKNIRKTTV
jgi:hypothetical protein